MGVFDEVYKKCPHCGGRGYTQIKLFDVQQINLDDIEDLAGRFNEEDLTRLYNAVKKTDFECRQCKRSFWLTETDNLQNRLRLAQELFGTPSSEETSL